jgi:hypothetical protein
MIETPPPIMCGSPLCLLAEELKEMLGVRERENQEEQPKARHRFIDVMVSIESFASDALYS